MRVIAGTARGTHLLSVKGQKTRPVLDRVKEALFNIIREFVPDGYVIDLFAGTGGLGIEALSRGAAFCIFVDKDYQAVQVIKKNLIKAGLADRARVLRLDVFRVCAYLIANHLKLDLVLAGPPYEMVEREEGRERILFLFQEMAEKGILKPDGIIVLQHRKQHGQTSLSMPPQASLEIFDQRCYGETQLTFIKSWESGGRSHIVNIKAPAKVNLFLEVFGKRYDGYHEIETVMQEIDLVDDIVIEEKEKGVELTCLTKAEYSVQKAESQKENLLIPQTANHIPHPRVPAGKDNIVWKAAELMQKETGVNKGAKIHLVKRIPMGAGLGGGSSDAAATLKGLNKLWRVGLNEDELMRLASMLGSDVPFFIKGNTAICRGRGEIVTPVPISTYFSYVLLYPDIEISTASIYQNLKIDLTKAVKDVRFLLETLKDGNPENVGKLLYNRLEEVALRLYPDLRRIKETLRAYNFCGLLLSGSGSVIYGLCRSQSDAEEIKNQLDRRGLGQVFSVTNRLVAKV